MLIKVSERCAFFGRTGSGKTTLAKALLAGVNSFVVLDAKHTFEMPGVDQTVGFDEKKSDKSSA